jgi:hypothetical protein
MTLLISGTGHQRRNRDAAVQHFLTMHTDAVLQSETRGIVEYDNLWWRISANANPTHVMVTNSTTPEGRGAGARDYEYREIIQGHIFYRQMKDGRLVLFYVTRMNDVHQVANGRASIKWEELKPLADRWEVFKAPGVA